jgi:hypothetical protein
VGTVRFEEGCLVAGRTEPKSMQELAAMSEDDRVEHFLANPMDGQDPTVDPSPAPAPGSCPSSSGAMPGSPSGGRRARREAIRTGHGRPVRPDRLPQPIAGRPDCRLHVGRGTYVAAYAVAGQLAPDGWTEPVEIEIERNPPGTAPGED